MMNQDLNLRSFSRTHTSVWFAALFISVTTKLESFFFGGFALNRAVGIGNEASVPRAQSNAL